LAGEELGTHTDREFRVRARDQSDQGSLSQGRSSSALQRAVRTVTFCVYLPSIAQVIQWSLD